MLQSSSEYQLITCSDNESYEQVIHSGSANTLPIFGQPPASNSGLPANINVIDFTDWQVTAKNSGHAIIPADNRRLCLSVADPNCIAVSRFISTSCGKQLSICAAEQEWETLLKESLRQNPDSLTLVIPSWHDTNPELAPQWLIRSLAVLRQIANPELSWGIITGSTANILSLVAAKTVLQAAIQAAYDGAGSTLVTTDAKQSMVTPFEMSNTPWHLFDEANIADGSASQITGQAWETVVFKCHGRSYCACAGYLCGARRLSDDPFQKPASCVMDLQCVDNNFPQIDPRQLDTPILVLDSCGTANWASPVWRSGIPALAFFALAGAASAVITSDGLTIIRPEDYVDVLWALSTANTMGEASARFNLVRQHAAPSAPYFLFGDPDLPAGVARWPNWVTTIELGDAITDTLVWNLTVPDNAKPFLRILIPAQFVNHQQVIFIYPQQEDITLQGCRRYQAFGQTELWLNKPPADTELVIEIASLPDLPDGLLAAAGSVSQQLLSWQTISTENSQNLLAAAEQIMQSDALLTAARQGISLAPVIIFELMLRAILEQWQQAHDNCLQELSTQTQRGLWPSSLWVAKDYQAENIDLPCPYCGLATTIRRHYHSPPGIQRAWWECLRCDLIEDRPLLDDYPSLDLQMPDTLSYANDDGSVDIELILDNPVAGITCYGAGLVAIEGADHGVSPAPDYFSVQLNAGQKIPYKTRLILNHKPPVQHLYRLRAILLLNGHWFWASRFIIVKE